MVCEKDSTFFAGNKIITFRDIVAMRAVALLLITVSVRNNNGKLLCHCRLVATDVIELAGCHFIGCRWLFLAKKTLNCSFRKLQSVGVAPKKNS